MESLMSRWKDKLNSEYDADEPLAHLASSLKKSNERSRKKMTASVTQEIKPVKNSQTPIKRKREVSKDLILDHTLQSLRAVFPDRLTDKMLGKMRCMLEELWAAARETQQQQIAQPQPIKESTVSTASKHHERLYHEMQKKYFQCEKEKHHLKSKLEILTQKYEGIDQELGRFAKIDRLIDNSLAREDYLKLENERLKGDLEMAQRRDNEQQKMFRREVEVVRGLVDSLRGTLPQQ